MIETLLQTDANYVCTFVRIIAGIIIFPYGMQKLFGWFDGVGINRTIDQMAAKRVPKFIAWMIIIGQSFGSMALILGFLGRIAAGGRSGSQCRAASNRSRGRIARVATGSGACPDRSRPTRSRRHTPASRDTGA